jgi:two-component system response regulator PilR (NtrC family)
MTPPYHLLIADDDENLRDALRMALESQGYWVSMAGSGEEAIAVARVQYFHCAILDYRMGDMTGLEVFRQLSALGVAPAGILISAELERTLERQAFQAGIAGCLKKPIYPDVLRRAVAGVLGEVAPLPGHVAEPRPPRRGRRGPQA